MRRTGAAGLAVAAMLAVAVSLTGCGAPPASRSVRPGPAAGGQATPDPTAASLGPRQLAAADTAFGWALFQRLCASAAGGNLLLSPASASQALGMLQTGATPATADALSRLLRLPRWGPALLAGLHEQATELTGSPELAVSNHVFEQTGLAAPAALVDQLRLAYRADLRHLDFAGDPAGATDDINAAVRRDTHGLVPALFDIPLPPNTVTVLTDAISLDARWDIPFPTAAAAPFYTATGRTVSASMMFGDQLRLRYRSAGGWQAVTIPYRGGRLQAVALLPPVRAPACVSPGPAQLAALTGGPVDGSVGVRLPELRLAQTWQLLRTLLTMGLPTGGYPGFAGGAVSEVVQKTVLQVDRAGTRAAAATGLALTTSMVAPTRIVTFDRPFLLLLQDTATGTPLFLARIADPTRSS